MNKTRAKASPNISDGMKRYWAERKARENGHWRAPSIVRQAAPLAIPVPRKSSRSNRRSKELHAALATIARALDITIVIGSGWASTGAARTGRLRHGAARIWHGEDWGGTDETER